jgi:uncharacterized protein (UPF0335 family)
MNKHNTEHMRELLEKIERLESEGRAVAEALQFVRRVKDDEVSSLFQALARERARYAELLEKIERLEAENRDMREALEFYADKKTWGLTGSLKNMRQFGRLEGWGPPLEDYDNYKEPNIYGYEFEDDFLTYKIAGRRAREVLAKWGKK